MNQEGASFISAGKMMDDGIVFAVESGLFTLRPKGKGAVFLPPRLTAWSRGKLGKLHTIITPPRSCVCASTLSVQLPRSRAIAMAPWDDFDQIFAFNKKYSYEPKVVDQILSSRRALENQLFADRLLGLLGIKGGMRR